MRVRRKNLHFLMIMVAVVILNVIFLYLIGGDALEEQNRFQFFADSNTYLKVSRGEYRGFEADSPLLSVSSNYLGPVLILRLLANDIYLVTLFNCMLFFLSVVQISKLLEMDPLKLCLILFLNPLTISSLLSVNKEILGFGFLAFALKGHVRRSYCSVVLALIISFISRWHLTVFYLLFLVLSMPSRALISRKQLVVFLLGGLSVVYMLSQSLIQPILSVVERSIADYEGGGSGMYEMMLALQAKGLYFLIFPLKAAQLLFALGVRMDKLFFPDNIYNDVFVVLNSTAFIGVFLVMVRRKLTTLQSDLFYLSVLYLVVFCLTPIFAPRYFYFIYLLWALLLAGAPSEIGKLPVAQCRGRLYKLMRQVAARRA